MDGPVKAFINKGGDHHYLGIRFPETSEYAGTSVVAVTTDGKKISDFYIIGEGLSSDQTNVLILGLGLSTEVISLTINYPSGETQRIENPEIDKVHFLKESGVRSQGSD